MPVATWRQQSFAWYTDDGGEGTNQIGATNANPGILAADTTQYRLRYLIQEYANSDQAETPTFELWYRVDATGGTSFGAWTVVDSDDTYFTTVGSAGVSDGSTTTQQIGAGTFNDGEFVLVDTGGSATNAMAATAGNDEYECEWVLEFAETGLSANFEFRVELSGGTDLDSYINTTQVSLDHHIVVAWAELQYVESAAAGGIPALTRVSSMHFQRHYEPIAMGE